MFIPSVDDTTKQYQGRQLKLPSNSGGVYGTGALQYSAAAKKLGVYSTLYQWERDPCLFPLNPKPRMG